jgi:hypothetical protein
LLRISLLLALFILTFESRAAVGVRLVMGLTDSDVVRWDGSVAASDARITKLDPWRFDATPLPDSINGNSWIISTHRLRWFRHEEGQPPFVADGVIVWLDGENASTQLAVTTKQGDFNVRLADIPYGKTAKLLEGRVAADRIPPSFPVTNSPDEEDYPAIAADKAGDLWLAYVAFRHNPDHDRIRAPFERRPADFEDMAAPAGGDQIIVRKFSGNAWGHPIEITSSGGDVYRPAIAIDGSGRPWVFWSGNHKGNFEIWGRVVENATAGRVVQISNASGSDIDPVAATDSLGRVWVAWQGWRDGKASIFAATQDGTHFTSATVVARSGSNEWNPAIAADKTGRVSVAWDSYRNGNYDVYVRTATAPGVWQGEMPVADSARYEAYPSIAYDSFGRLWVAYEEGGERWGKDWGTFDTTGVWLYQARAIRLVAFDHGGKSLTTRSDIGDVLPGIPTQHGETLGTQNEAMDWIQPNPRLVKERAPNETPATISGPKNSLPRLTVDNSGRLLLTFRSAVPIRWSMLGSVWSEYVATYDGRSWSRPIYLAHTDNLLDNRPAVISPRPGELIVIGSSDGRGDFETSRSGRAPAPGRSIAIDRCNNDLYASLVSAPPVDFPIEVRPAARIARTVADPRDAVEKAAIERMRAYRVQSDGGQLRLVRGEFHRHSEISSDGGFDGSLLDQWRYILDAAGLDWIGCCDHDNGGGREYSWWITQKETDIFNAPGSFASLFSYERSVDYPEGHRNVVFAQRGIRPLPRLPAVKPESAGHAPDTLMLYAYLERFHGIVASHSTTTDMGTDWRDNNPDVEPAVELFDGLRQNAEMPDAPRTSTEGDSIGGWRPQGFVNAALERGYRLGFEASSDHFSTHMSYCNIFVPEITREAVLNGFRKRHFYAATDNILAEVRSGSHLMGDEFTTNQAPELHVKLIGTAPFNQVHVIKDNKYVYSSQPKVADIEFTWRDLAAGKGRTSYYYVRGEQENGEIVWASPMWITYR